MSRFSTSSQDHPSLPSFPLGHHQTMTSREIQDSLKPWVTSKSIRTPRCMTVTGGKSGRDRVRTRKAWKARKGCHAEMPLGDVIRENASTRSEVVSSTDESLPQSRISPDWSPFPSGSTSHITLESGDLGRPEAVNTCRNSSFRSLSIELSIL